MIQKIIRGVDGAVITERPIGEIEIIRPPFKCIIKRNGQEDSQKGNQVVVQCLFFTIKSSSVQKFKSDLWGFRHMWLNPRIGNITNFAKRDFRGNTWMEAFQQAEVFFNEGCDEYERLLFEREQALKNAE